MNEVRIIVRAHNDVNRGFESARADVKRWADESAKIYTERITVNMQQMGRQTAGATTIAGREIGRTLGENTTVMFHEQITKDLQKLDQTARMQLTQTGQRIGRTIGESASTSINRTITDRMRSIGGDGGRGGNGSDSRSRGGRGGEGGRGGAGGSASVDVDKQSLFSRFSDWGKEAADKFSTGFSDGIKTIFSGDILSSIVKGIGIAGLAMTLAVPLSAAVTSAVGLALGGGVIALGIVAAFKDPRIKAAGEELKTKLGTLFAKFGEPFRGPVADLLEDINTHLLPQVGRLAADVAKVFAPLTKQLGEGVIGMLQNMLPGIASAMKDLAPVVEVLANRLPDIGRHIGDFFEKIGGQGDDAAVFFNDLITLINGVIDAVATLIATFTSMYANAHRAVKGVIDIYSGLWDALKGGIGEIIHFFGRFHGSIDDVKETFREFWEGVKRWLETGQAFFRSFQAHVIGVFENVLRAAVASMGWIPGLGGKLRGALAQFISFKNSVNAQLGGIRDRVVSVTIAYSYKTFGKPYSDVDPYAARGYAHGGITGAASGRVAGGLTWVGEQGPELVQLPAGSTVRSSGDSRRMLGQGGGGGGMQVIRADIDQGMENTLIGVLIRALRLYVGYNGGNVQALLGRTF